MTHTIPEKAIEAANTDRELWRERASDYYAPSIFVTAEGAIGINVGGHVIVRTVQDWHRAALPKGPALPHLTAPEGRLSEDALIKRLEECRSRVGKMCSEGRPPRMSIPADRERDDDLFITDTINEAIDRLTAAPAEPQAEELDEHFIQVQIDRAPEPLKRLGAFLADVLDEDHWKTAEGMLLALTSTAPQAQVSGWKLVPVEPTDEIRTAVARAIGKSASTPNHIQRAREVYAAMLAASPPAPSPDGELRETTTVSASGTITTGDQRPVIAERPTTMQKAVYAALGCTKIDFRSHLRVDAAAEQIVWFVKWSAEYNDIRATLAFIAAGKDATVHSFAKRAVKMSRDVLTTYEGLRSPVVNSPSNAEAVVPAAAQVRARQGQ